MEGLCWCWAGASAAGRLERADRGKGVGGEFLMATLCRRGGQVGVRSDGVGSEGAGVRITVRGDHNLMCQLEQWRDIPNGSQWFPMVLPIPGSSRQHAMEGLGCDTAQGSDRK